MVQEGLYLNADRVLIKIVHCMKQVSFFSELLILISLKIGGSYLFNLYLRQVNVLHCATTVGHLTLRKDD